MEKKTSCLLCVLTALLLAVLYLWAALRPGVWLRDAFLYRQADGSFSGKDAYAAYTMQIAQTGNGAEVEFTVDGETRHYRLESKAEGMSDPGVKIEQDGVVIFTGTALGDPGDAILWREDDGGLADDVNVIVNGEYQRSDLWPSCNWLYNVAVGGRRERRRAGPLDRRSSREAARRYDRAGERTGRRKPIPGRRSGRGGGGRRFRKGSRSGDVFGQSVYGGRTTPPLPAGG